VGQWTGEILSKGTYNDFFDALGFRESSNRYDVVNTYGSLGRYQMGEASFVDIGLYSADANPYDNVYGGTFNGKYGVYSVSDFLAKPAAQDEAIRDYMALQFAYLKTVWAYEGQTINGVQVTISGMLAAAHLMGWDGAATWLTSGGDTVPADNFGTTVTEYATLLGGYDTPFTVNHDAGDNLDGGSGSDILSGYGGDDTLSGKGGDDTLNGGAGNDTIDGGNGTDTAVFGAVYADFTITYDSGTGAYILTSQATGADSVKGVEKFQFSDQTIDAEDLLGSGGAVSPTVSISADSASKSEGNGGTTSFTFTVSLSAAAAAAATLSWTVAGSGANAADAGDFSGALTGTVSFAVGDISKTITVQVAGDTLFEANEGFNVTLSSLSSGLVAGTLSAAATISNDDVQTIFIGSSNDDTLTGGSMDDTLSGLGGNDTLTGNAGNDRLDGGAGDDTMRGGAGNDRYVVNSASDVVSETGGSGNDTVETTLQSYTLVSDIESLVFAGTLNFSGQGNNLANTITGGNGDDTLDGGTGADVLVGGLGNDTFIFDNTGDSVTEALSAGSDLVLSSVTVSGLLADDATAAMTGDHVERIQLTGASAINATGNGLANVITGNSAANVLSGGGGSDVLDGGAGNDTLSGGEGDDTLVGGSGNDAYAGGGGVDTVSFASSTSAIFFSLAATGQQNTRGAGYDTLQAGHSVENLIGGSRNDQLTGDSGANRIEGGAGNDVLNGGLGNDVLLGDAGADFFVFNTTLGSGNVDMIYNFDTADDTIRLENNGIFSAFRSTGQLSAGAFVVGTAALQSDDRIIYDPQTGALHYDRDGSGSAQMVHFASLINPVGTLSNTDFMII
jgi:serralysin